MINKLYNFLAKRSWFISFSVLASWVCFLFTLHANETVAAAALVVMCVSVTFACVLIWGNTAKSHARALQFLMDQRNSSSPHWDGQVRSAQDIEPRLKLLQDRVEQDQLEMNRIHLELIRASGIESQP